MLAFLALAGFAAGCSGGSGSPIQGINTGGTHPTATPTATAKATATPVGASPTPTGVITQSTCTNTVSQAVTAGGTATLTTSAATGTFTETIAAGQIATATTATLGYQAQGALAAPLARSLHLTADGRRTPMFTAGAGNTYVIALCAGFGGATPTSGVSLSGSGVVPATIATGTQLNIAILSGGTWVDVGTALVSATGNFQSTAPTVALPGVNQTGTYLVYEPAQGTNTATINLGIAIIGDDGSAGIANGLQLVQLEGATGAALPTPTSTFFPIDAFDLDGQSLTPDSSRGAVVDGSDQVYFFSGIPQHVFTLAPQTVSVSNYGSDGDSIASLPNGDEVVVSADDGGPLAVISGILAGSPVISDSIVIPPDGGTGTGSALRDGLVISTDGTVLLSRGLTGIDVYKVAQTAAHAGSTGMGTTSYSFTFSKTLVSANLGGPLSEPPFEDGRDGMAMSPVDASRAVVVGHDAGDNPLIQLVTGLNTTTPTINSLPLHVPHVARKLGSRVRLTEPSAHRSPYALSPPTTDGTLYAVAITPDGTTAFVSSQAGILVISGVNTGTLAQVGAIYAPTLTTPGGGTCPLVAAPTIGVLPDGKYLIANVNCSIAEGSQDTTQGTSVLVTIPISGTTLGAPVGQYNNTVSPQNDQMITH